MSEAMLTAAFLSVSGGLQDAYTYFSRGNVFANAQTGNIVLLSRSICERDWSTALHYLIPLLAFSLGVISAEQTRRFARNAGRIHWRQTVLLGEILLLLTVGFLPARLNMLANALVSFACAMQVQAFQKLSGYAFSSTMCIGNIRSGTEALCLYFRTHDRSLLRKALHYWAIIFLFGLGAGLGGYLVSLFEAKAILFSCGLLLTAFFLMFIRRGPDSRTGLKKE